MEGVIDAHNGEEEGHRKGRVHFIISVIVFLCEPKPNRTDHIRKRHFVRTQSSIIRRESTQDLPMPQKRIRDLTSRSAGVTEPADWEKAWFSGTKCNYCPTKQQTLKPDGKRSLRTSTTARTWALLVQHHGQQPGIHSTHAHCSTFSALGTSRFKRVQGKKTTIPHVVYRKR